MDSGPAASHSALKVFLFTDVVGSTEFKRVLGDRAGAEVIARHDALFRDCLAEFGGEESGHSGDGFFALFDLPSAAVRCALAFNLGLQKFQLPMPMKVRIGLHVGESIMLAHGGTGGTQDKPIGLAVDLASRVMELAEPGQILMTRAAFDSCRQQVSTAPNGQLLHWLAHGQYLFKGLDEPIEIYEAGIDLLSPLAPPSGKAKAIRAISPEEEETLGWRPAVGQGIPQRESWVLERKLGEGGFGEVWLAKHAKTGEPRTFKFCFRADRLRTLKRELTLFRLIKDVLGERPDIARLIDVKLDAPPFFLEMEYTAGGDIKTWADAHGGISEVPLETRLLLATQIADALAAAHSVGVIHKDVKPRNVLVYEHPAGGLQARLTDFGIGQLLAPAVSPDGRRLEGFSTKSSTVLSELGSRTGTRVYMAPELLAGKEPSVQSDIYAFGVMVYQLALADLDRPLGQGWQRDVSDELIREVISGCVDGDPQRRYASAAEPAEILKKLDQIRAERAEARRAAEAAVRAGRLRRRLAWGLAASLAAVLLASFFAFRERRRAEFEAGLRAEADTQRVSSRRNEYRAQVQLSDSQLQQGQMELARETLWQVPPEHRGWEWDRQLAVAYADLYALYDRPLAQFSPSGKYLLTASRDDELELRDPLDGAIIRQFDRPAGLPLPLAFSADETLLAAGSPYGTIRIFDVENGQTLRDIAAHEAVVAEIVFAPAQAWMISGAQDGKVRIWNPADGTLVREIADYDLRVHYLKVTSDGRYLIVGLGAAEAGAARASVRDLQTGAEVIAREGRLASFSAAGGRIALQRRAEVEILDLSTLTTAWIWESKVGEVAAAEISPDGGVIAVTNGAGEISFLDRAGAETGEPVRAETQVEWLAFTPDSRTLAAAGYRGAVALIDVRSGRILSSLRTSGDVTSCQMRPQGDRFLLASNREASRVWPVAEFGSQQAVLIPEREGEAVAFSGDQSLAAALAPGRTAYLLEAGSGRTKAAFAAFARPVYARGAAVALSPDGKRIAAALDEFTAFVIDAETGALVCKFAGHEGIIHSVAFSPDGAAVASTSWDNTVRIWNSTTGEQIANLQGHKSDVLFAAFSPDGSQILTGAEDGEARLWDRAAAREIRLLHQKSGAIGFVGFSLDGARAFVGSRDGLGRVYDARTGALLQTLRGHDRGLRWIAASKDGSRMLTASGDGSAIIRDAMNGESLLRLRLQQDSPVFAGFDPAGEDVMLGGRAVALRRFRAASSRAGEDSALPAAEARERFESARAARARAAAAPAAENAAEPATLHIYAPRATFEECLARLAADVAAHPDENLSDGIEIDSEVRAAAVVLASLRPGDRIRSAVGQNITSKETAATALAALRTELARLPGAEPQIALLRLGVPFNAKFHFVEPIAEEQRISVPRGELAAFLRSRRDYLAKYKARAIEIHQSDARVMGILPESPESLHGLWASEVSPVPFFRSLPKFGLASGDRITSMGGRPIDSFESCIAAFDAAVNSLDQNSADLVFEAERGRFERRRINYRAQ